MIRTVLFTLIVACSGLCVPSNAEAGPLLDWLRGLRQRRTCNTWQPNYRTAYANPMNLQPGQCARTCTQTCSRTVVNYVPHTAYRTAWSRVPVTQYRPVTNSDPCTGCTVTCMRPCTTYTWQMRRVPYTTYRPVYRTQTYRVPVTTITNDCNPCQTGACGVNPCGINNGCAPCNVTQTPTAAANNGTYYTNPNDGSVINGDSLSTEGSFSTPANVPPSLSDDVNPTTSQRPSVLDQMQDSSTSWPSGSPIQQVGNQGTETQSNIHQAPQQNNNQGWDNSRPAYIDVNDKTALSPIRERWSYSPVRLASYNKPAPIAETLEVRGTLAPASRPIQKPTARKANAGWETVSW